MKVHPLLLPLLIVVAADVNAENTIRVDPSDPAALHTLREAAAIVEPGDTIWLAPNSGPYREPLYISRSGTAEEPIVVEGNGNEITGFDELSFSRRDDGGWEVAVPVPYPFVLRHEGVRILEDAITKTFQRGVFYDPDNKILVLPASESPDGWEISVRNFAVKVLDASFHVYRDIVATGSTNDGFNLHGTGRGLVFENIVGCQNLDEGFSAHEQIKSEIDGGIFWGNDNGIYNIGDSLTFMRNVDIYDNLGIGLALANGSIFAKNLRVWGNCLAQVKIENDCHLAGDGIYVYTQPYATRPWVTYNETKNRTHLVRIDYARASTDNAIGIEEVEQIKP
jgi:hypothetical protein